MDARERRRLAGAVVQKVADFRAGEIAPLNRDGVTAWLEQFDVLEQPAVLRETARLLDACYISRPEAKRILDHFAREAEFAQPNVRAFWRSAVFLDIQQRGSSQSNVLDLHDEVLQEVYGFGARRVRTRASRSFVYLDDVLCTGNRVRYDLARWMDDEDINDADIFVVALAAFRNAGDYVRDNLRALLRSRGCTLKMVAGRRYENRPAYVLNSRVFWPTQLPNDPIVDQWTAALVRAGHRDYFRYPRPPGGNGSTELFSSEEARQTIEQAFMKKGAYIWSICQAPQDSMRPLGFSKLRTPGFGAPVITWRNCPNNAPLVVWWGDPNANGPLNRWRPLLSRRINNNG